MVAYTSVADPGTFTLAGQDALFARGYVGHSMPGRFSISGGEAALYGETGDHFFHDDVCEWSDTAGTTRPYVLKGAVQSGDMISGSLFRDVCREGEKYFVAVRDGLRFEWLSARYSAPNLIVPITVQRSSAAPRTNAIRNNMNVGAVIGAPGTLPTNWSEGLAGTVREVVDTGKEGDIDYIDLRFSGTHNGTNITVRGEPLTDPAIVASQNQTWVYSVFVRLIAGSLTNVSSVNLNIGSRDAAAVALENTPLNIMPNLSVASLASARVSVTRQMTAVGVAYTSHSISIGASVGAAVDLTLRIGWMQLEQGSVATTPIPTSGSAVTTIAVDWPVGGRRIVRLTNASADVIRRLRRQTGEDGSLRYTVVNGQTLTLPVGASVVLLLPPGGGIAGMTVVLPPGGEDLDTIEFITTQPITAFTVTGAAGDTAYGSGYTLSVGASYRLRGANRVWYRRY